jgi:DNA gyrase/topoisomerase IV subunit B
MEACQAGREPEARAVLRGKPAGRQTDHPEGARCRARPPGCAEGAELTRRKRRSGRSLPGKLADCEIGDPESAELFLVEGNPPAASAVDARDRLFQAIPPRGKVINAEKNRINKKAFELEIQAMVTAIGTWIADEFDIAKLATTGSSS